MRAQRWLNLRVVSPFRLSISSRLADTERRRSRCIDTIGEFRLQVAYKWGRECALELTHWPPVITPREFRWTEGLCSRKRLSIEREERRILYRKFASYIDHIVAVVNLSLWSASEWNNGVTSLAAVSLYWSVHACERRASTLSWCHQRLIELRPSFISPCYGLLCYTMLYVVIASHDNVTFKKLQTYGFLIYDFLLLMQ